MDVTSGDPNRLRQFTLTASQYSASLAQAAQAANATYAQVRQNSSQFAPDLHSLVAAQAFLTDLGATEAFIEVVAQALVSADAYQAGGLASVGDGTIAGLVAASGGLTTSGLLTIDDAALLGDPPSSGFCDDPVCAATGNFVHHEVDLAFPARTGILNLTRCYNSLSPRVGAFGRGWSSLLDVRLLIAEDTVTAHLPDGAQIAFQHHDGTWRGHARPTLSLRASVTDGWELADGPASGYTFDRDGTLVARWAGRARITLHRSQGAIVAITEETSGRSVSLSWSHGQVVGVASSDGREVAYSFTGHTLLGVARPSGAVTYRHAGDGRITAVTDADGVVLVTNTYDDAGRVATQTSAAGRVSTYAYGEHRLTVVVGDEGIRNAFVHDPRGNLISLVDAAGRAMRMRYDAAGRLVGWRDRRGADWSTQWDTASGRPVLRSGPLGWEERFVWDAQGRIASRTTPAGTTSWAYEGDLRTPSRIIDPSGAETLIGASTDDLAVSVTDADGVRLTLTYDADGQVTSATDPLGNTTRLTYHDAGQLSAWRLPSSISARFVTDAAGRVRQAVSPGGTAAYEWSPAGRGLGGVDPVEGPWSATFLPSGAVASVTTAAGASTAFGWDACGNLVTITGPDGRVYSQGFDGACALVSATDPAGETWTYERDAEGTLTGIVGPTRAGVHRRLDLLGREVARTDAAGRVWARTWGPDGRLASMTDPAGAQTFWTYDADGRVTAVSDDQGELATMTWSPAGRLLRRQRVGGADTSYRYDQAGRLVGMADAGGSVQLVLDVDGRVVRAEDQRGRVITVTRDNAGRAVSVVDRAGTVRSLGLDDAGRIVHTATGPADASFEWDRSGLLTGAVDAMGARTSFSHDVAGRRTSMTDPLGGVMSCTYDAAGRVASLSDPAGQVTALLRDPAGALTGVAAGRAGTRVWRDTAGLVVGWSGLGDPAPSVNLERDATGRVAGLPGARDIAWLPRPPHADHALDPIGRIAASPRGDVFRHDLAGQLVEWVAPGGAAVRYTYDAGGRLVDEAGPQGRIRYAYDAGGRLVARTGPDGAVTAFACDEWGRRIAEVAATGRVDYRWDAAGRLVGVRRGGRELVITTDNLGRPTSVGGVDIEWDLSSGWPVVCRIGDVRYERDDENVLAVGPSGERTPSGTDGLGSGETAADPWGSSSGQGVRLGYRGELCIDGLVWLGARVYDPATRAFLSPDPLPNPPGMPCGANPYHYAWNDPVSLVDPTGLRPLTQADFEAYKHRDQTGSLRRDWDAVKKDPWGDLALGLTVALGVGLLFVPGGEAAGAGILIGVAMSTATSVATGNFNPRVAAVTGLVGGISGGTADLLDGAAPVVQTLVKAGINSGGDLANQVAGGGPISWRSTLMSAGMGGLDEAGSGISSKLGFAEDVNGLEAGAVAPTTGDLVGYDPQWASRQALGQNAPGSEGFGITPAGRTMSAHAAERVAFGAPGRPPINLQAVDDILDQGTAVRFDPIRNTIQVGARQMPGNPFVVVNSSGTHIVTVMMPK